MNDDPVQRSPAIIALRGARNLPDAITPQLEALWQDAITGYDRERGVSALEVATLLALRQALRNGSVWIEHSLTFHSCEQLFIADSNWDDRGARPL